MISEEEKNRLLEKRSTFIGIQAELSKVVDPKIFKLAQEEISNIRNLVVIAGTVAPFAILLFGSFASDKQYLSIAVSGILLTVIFGLIILNNEVSRAIKSYQSAYKKEMDLADDFLVIIYDRLHENINAEDFAGKEAILNKKAEEKFRPQKIKESPQDYSDRLLLFLFVISVITLVASMWF
jgi:hypothetical protein